MSFDFDSLSGQTWFKYLLVLDIISRRHWAGSIYSIDIIFSIVFYLEERRAEWAPAWCSPTCPALMVTAAHSMINYYYYSSTQEAHTSAQLITGWAHQSLLLLTSMWYVSKLFYFNIHKKVKQVVQKSCKIIPGCKLLRLNAKLT